MAKDLNVSQKTLLNIFKKDLKLKAYRKKRIHGLTEKQKEMRETRISHILSDKQDAMFL